MPPFCSGQVGHPRVPDDRVLLRSVPGKDAVKSVTALFQALDWIEAERGAPPPLALVKPTATRQDANFAVVRAFFAQSSLSNAGFHKGGVMPFWESGVMSTQSFKSVGEDEIKDILTRDPRAFLNKSDHGANNFLMHGMQKYMIGIVDAWSPEEPCSKQPLKPLMS